MTGCICDLLFGKYRVYLFILRMHCWEAFSLSQSALRVGSQEAAWIWERRPPPATPSPTLARGKDVCTTGGTGTTGTEESGVNEFPKPTAAVTAGTGATVRPACAGEAGGGEARSEPDGTPLAPGCPSGRELAKVGSPCPVTPKPWASLLHSSPKLSAMMMRQLAAS